MPTALVVAAAVYVGATALLLAAAALLALPVVCVVRRPKSRYFDDWRGSVRAPWLFWRVGGALYRLQEVLGNYVLPAPQRVCELAYSYVRAQVVIAVSALGIPDLLHANGGRPMSAAELAAATGARRDYLERVLRAAGRCGLLRVHHLPCGDGGADGGSSSKGQQRRRRGAKAPAGGSGSGGDAGATSAPPPPPRELRGPLDLDGAAYSLTALSAVLCRAHPNCVADMVALFADHYGPAGRLADGLAAGRPPYELWSGGLGHWAHLASDAALRARFDAGMVGFNALAPLEAVFAACPALSAAARVVDVGGGLGGLLAEALARHPRQRGVLFDLPRVAEAARREWEADAARRPLLARVEFVGGSFFEAGGVPRALGPGGGVESGSGGGDGSGGPWSGSSSGDRGRSSSGSRAKRGDGGGSSARSRSRSRSRGRRAAAAAGPSSSGAGGGGSGGPSNGAGGPEVYVLREILHDWGDADALAILKQVIDR